MHLLQSMRLNPDHVQYTDPITEPYDTLVTLSQQGEWKMGPYNGHDPLNPRCA